MNTTTTKTATADLFSVAEELGFSARYAVRVYQDEILEPFGEISPEGIREALFLVSSIEHEADAADANARLVSELRAQGRDEEADDLAESVLLSSALARVDLARLESVSVTFAN